jgi:hypothetical protein
MALIGINPVGNEPQKESGLDKVLKGLQIAQGLMGTALVIPKFMQERDEFKAMKGMREAQGQKFIAEAEQTRLDNAPVTSDKLGWFKQQGVPEAALPKTMGQARGLAEKLIETPAQKESRLRSEASLRLAEGTYKRLGDKDIRDIEKEKSERRERERKEFEEKYVPGVGLAYTLQDAKDLKDGVEQKSKFDRQIQEMIDLRTKFGFEVGNRAAVARGKQLSKDLLLTYKNMAKLGVLSQSDEAIVNAIIPADPLAATLPGQGPDPILEMLTKFKNDLSLDFDTRIQNRIKTPESKLQKELPLSNEDQDALDWANENPNDPRAKAIMRDLGVQ